MKTAVAKLVEDYKIRKENVFRETMIIRSGFAFDAPSGRHIGGSGDGSAFMLRAMTHEICSCEYAESL